MNNDENDERLGRIRSLNDALRTAGRGGRVVVSRSLADLGPGMLQRAVEALRSFAAFTPDNDPHGEHDYASFEIDGQTVMFKIDYYDPSYSFGSEDPADPMRCGRLLTLMLASDY